MPGALFNPDNRLLSWSIGDMSLYGATVAPAAAPVEEDKVAQPMDAATAPAPAPASEAGADQAIQIVDLEASDTQAIAPTALTSGATAALPMTAASAPAAGFSPAVPAETGSGSVASAPLTAPGEAHAVSAMPGAASLAPGDLPLTLVAPTIVGLIDSAPTISIPVVEHVTDALQTATVDVATATDAAVDVAHAASEPVTNLLDSTVAEALDTAQSSDTIVTAAIGDVVQALSASDPSTTLGDVGATLSDSTAQANDLLTGIGGTDPAGGVNTLVEMVAAADQFDLSHATVPDLADTGSIADLLAHDVADAPLIDDVHTSLSGHDDHHVGVFGL